MTRLHRLRALALLALLVAVAYGGALRNGFVFDDAIFVERDPRLESLDGVRRLFSEPLWGFNDKHGERGIHQYYRPLQLLAPAVSKMLLGGAAWPVHLISLVLHLACAMMVYELLLRCCMRSAGATRTREAPPAVIGAPAAGPTITGPPTVMPATIALVLAAIFAVHPANSEAVLWASDLSGLGATACMLAVVLLHGARVPAALGAPLAGTLCLAATFFKESGVLTPALMLLYDLLVRRRGERSSARVLADYTAVAIALAVYFPLRVRALGGMLPGADTLELGPAELVWNAFALLPSYVRAFVWPFELNMYHDFDVARAVTDTRVIVGMVVAGVFLAATFACLRRAPLSAFGLAWAALTVAPWLVVRWPQLNAFAERYLYLPSIGLYFAMAPLLMAVAARRRVVPAAIAEHPVYEAAPVASPRQSPALRTALFSCALGLIGAFVVRDVLRTPEWKDEVTIYTRTLEKSPRAELIRNNLALRYLDLGEPERGIPIQQELLRIDPAFPSGWHNMGLLLLKAGRNDEARAAFEKSGALEPHNAATALNLGYVYDLTGKREQAVEQYFLATILDHRDAKPWYNLALIAYEQGQLTNARRALAEVLSRQPDDRAARDLQVRLASTGPPPRDAQSAQATLRRCDAARTALQAGRFREAVIKLEMAAWLDERAPLPHHYLANVRYLSGKYREAHRHEQDALRRDPDNELYKANVAALEETIASGDKTGAPPSFR